MVPHPIQEQLARLDRRDRWVRFCWRSACALAVLVAALALSCLADWLIDRWTDTPWSLRVGLLVGQIVLGCGALGFLGLTLLRRRSDADLALWVEERRPELGHRLISAVELNRKGARTAGMSANLIAQVTREAETQIGRMDLAALVDHQPQRRGLALACPLVAAVGMIAFFCWGTVQPLLARQVLAQRDIPRSVALVCEKPEMVSAAGEPVVLRFRATGASLGEDVKGVVCVEAPGRPAEWYELTVDSQSGDHAATCVAEVAAGSADFHYWAWLKDGRTRQPGSVHLEPRPVVQALKAFVLLPEQIGSGQDGTPLEEPQKGGDIVHRFPGEKARVVIEAQKPLRKVRVEVLGAELVRRTAVREIPPDQELRAVEVEFPLDFSFRPEAVGALGFQPAGGLGGLPLGSLLLSTRPAPLPPESSYRVVVEDQFGLVNADPPRRGIRSGGVEPPSVTLLPDLFSPAGMAEEGLEDVPVLEDQPLRVIYQCAAPYGLSHARLRYRVLRRAVAGAEESSETAEGEFIPLPLGRRAHPGDAERNPTAEFYALPPANPGDVDGTQGGGLCDFDTRGIPDGKGGTYRLQRGDRIQYYVEVFGRANPDGPAGRSVMREKSVVDELEFKAIVARLEDQKDRIRKLEEKQRGKASEAVEGLPVVNVPQRQDGRPTGQLREGTLGRSWQLLGPFADPDGKGHDREYTPEQEPIADLDREHDGARGKVRWQTYYSSGDRIDLEKIFTYDQAGVAYAVCWVHTYSRKPVLLTGSDDGIKVWIDRHLVLDRATRREAVAGEDRTPLSLAAGWHEVLVKVDNAFGSWAFYLDIVDATTGKQSPETKIQLTPAGLSGPKVARPWLILGPFASPGPGGHDQVYPPEEEKQVDLRPTYDGRYGKIRWRAYLAEKDEVDLRKAFPPPPTAVPARAPEPGVAYGVFWVKAQRKQTAALAVWFSDGIKVWLNHKQVLDRKEGTGPPTGKPPTVELTPGWNEVLIKCDNAKGRWFFTTELRDPNTGKPLEGVIYRWLPPEKE